VGCGDAFGSRVVRQEVGSLCVMDFDPVFIEDVKQRMDPKWPMEARVHDILHGPPAGQFDAAYSLDVIEHIPCSQENLFMDHITAPLAPQGVLIIGTPTIQSQAHASPQSKEGHVNCKDHKDLRGLLRQYFHNIFLFSMNDEVVHTGFYPMAHYLLAICTGKKTREERDSAAC
jgi:2-polyprenyl-3-methyl-5-hydroxy-6-metoxy-1,4-benzoquinol methylase